MKFENLLGCYPDFPIKGVLFRDICPILSTPGALKECVSEFVKLIKKECPGVTHIAGLDARGFIFAPTVAIELGVGFIPIRKDGKLPGDLYRVDSTKEYGKDSLTMQKNVLNDKSKVVIIDDLLATGGSLAAGCNLVKQATGSFPCCCIVLVELSDLNGKDSLPTKCLSIIKT